MIDTMYLKITENCNLSCPFCYVKQKQNVISFETAVSAIEAYQPKEVIFHGGAPLLHPKRTLEIIDRFPSQVFSITSNLTLPLTDERMEILERCYVATSYSADRFPNSELEQIFKKNVAKVRETEDVTLLVTLSEKQLEMPPVEFIRKLDEIGYDSILFERMYAAGLDKAFAEKMDMYLLELMKALPDARKNYLYDQMMESIISYTYLFPLTCDRNVVTVNPDGSILSCPNLCHHAERKKRRECLECNFYQYCRGDCLSFQDCCMFPKKTITYLKEEILGWQ